MASLRYIGIRQISRHKLRTTLISVAVAAGVSLLMVTLAAPQALYLQARQLGRNEFGKASVLISAFGPAGLNAADIKGIASLPGVKVTVPMVEKRILVRHASGYQVLTLIGVDPKLASQVFLLKLHGSLPSATSMSQVDLGSAYAKAAGVKTGQVVQLLSGAGFVDFTVAGTISGGLPEAAYGQVAVVSLSAAQKMFSQGARIQTVAVTLSKGASWSTFRHLLPTVMQDDYTVLLPSQVIGSRSEALSLLQPVLWFLAFVSLLVGLFLVYTTVTLDVSDRRHDIGLLKAAGATPRQVAGIFATQALIMGVIGVIIGELLGAWLSQAAVKLVGGSTPAGHGLAYLALPAALSAAAGLLTTLLGSWIPARASGRMSPIEALRPRLATADRRSWGLTSTLIGICLGALGSAAILVPGGPQWAVAAGIVTLLPAVVLLLPALMGPLTWLGLVGFRSIWPVECTLVRSSLLSHRARSAAALSSVVLVAAIILALGGLAQSAAAESSSWVGQLFVSPYVAVSPIQQPMLIRQAFDQVKGVRATMPVSTFEALSANTEVAVAAVDLRTYLQDRGLQLEGGNRSTALAQMANQLVVVIPEQFAQSRHVWVGDRIPLSNGHSTRYFTVAAVAYHTMPGQAGVESILVSREQNAGFFGLDWFNLLEVTTASQPPAQMVHGIGAAALSLGMQLVSVSQIDNGVGRGINSLFFVLGALAFVAVIIGMIGVADTILVTVNQSMAELGLLRAVGMTGVQIRRIVLLESVTMGLLGSIAGIGLGILILLGLISHSSTPQFHPGFVAPYRLALGEVAGAMLACLVGAYLPALRAVSSGVPSQFKFT